MRYNETIERIVMYKLQPNCEVCNKPGGDVPKYYKKDGVKVMLHHDCSVKQMRKYQIRSEQIKEESP